MHWAFWSVLYALLAVPAWFGVCIGVCWLSDPEGRTGVATAYAFAALLGSPLAAVAGLYAGWWFHG